MDTKGFKAFCNEEFEKRGFKKYKKEFYLAGDDVLCGMHLQRSRSGNAYYINYYFFVGDYRNQKDYPTYYDSDIDSRITVMSKGYCDGKHYMTSLIEYENYTEDELRPFFENDFEKFILPPVREGRKFILDNLNKLYYLTLRADEVMAKLKA